LLTFYLITSMIGAFASGYFCGKSWIPLTYEKPIKVYIYR
jgi:hypothetical protein